MAIRFVKDGSNEVYYFPATQLLRESIIKTEGKRVSIEITPILDPVIARKRNLHNVFVDDKYYGELEPFALESIIVRIK